MFAAATCPTCRNSPGGLLGADFAIENGRYKVTRIYDNESWNPDLRRRWQRPARTSTVGDYILAINGIELKAPDNIYRLLDGTANRQTSLTVNNQPAMEGARHVTVVPVANEQALRTRAWVESNRRLVEKLPNGQLAYVYLPNTGQPGYTELQSLLLFAAGQERRDHRRAFQRRRLGGRLHHRRFAARLRRLLQQRRRRSLSVHQSVRRNLGAEGDDH